MSAGERGSTWLPAQGPAPEAAFDDLLDAVRRRAQALAAADAATLTALLHPEFRWTSHRGVLDRGTYIRNNTGGTVAWKSQSLHDVQVTVVDRIGVVTAMVTDVVERDGTAASFRMPMTQTWVVVGAEWQCLAGHAGPLLSPG